MTLIDKPLSSKHPEYCYDMELAPTGRKLIALNHGGVACFATLNSTNKKDFKAWSPLPKERK